MSHPMMNAEGIQKNYIEHQVLSDRVDFPKKMFLYYHYCMRSLNGELYRTHAIIISGAYDRCKDF